MYRRIEQLVGNVNGDLVAWDLYSGIGQIALIMARCGYRTLGIEENPEAVTAAIRNAERNRLPQSPSFMAGRVEDLIASVPAWARSPDLILVNPARTGLAESVRPILAGMLGKGKNTKLIYVSCEVKTLARDLKDLVAAGRHIIQLQAFDMFPHTDKMEWLAVIG
jgi:23S rRNA (uracil1939-C5)-methyltransferase